MDIKTSLCLLPVLISLVFAEVPTGCVHIKNSKKISMNFVFLKSSRSAYGKNHHVEYGGTAEKWIILKDGAHYKIKHGRIGEDLYVYIADNGPYVLTWAQKTKQNSPDAKWIISEVEAGQFVIKNVKYERCLNVGNMFWILAKEECKGSGFLWTLTKC